MKKTERKRKVLILIDFENLLRNMTMPEPKEFSMAGGFDKLMKEISNDLGDIINIFVFLPPHLTFYTFYGKLFHQLGFFSVLCPKIQNKKTGEEEDTVDGTIIEFGKKMLNQIPELTHLCVGSGDKDYASLIREAVRHGLKIAIIAGSLGSLSADLIKLADKRPNGKKMVYLLSPTED